MDKNTVRQCIRQNRENQGIDEFAWKSNTICKNIMDLDLFKPEYIHNKRIALYHTHKGEVDLTTLLEFLTLNNVSCYFPVTKPDFIVMEPYDSHQSIEVQSRIGAMGITEPLTESDHFEPMDLIIIPGIAYDLSGNRVGYGKGYYDRYLQQYSSKYTSDSFIRKPSRPILVAPAFDFQIVQKMEMQPHDIPVDIIVTECRKIILSSSRQTNKELTST